MANKNKKNGSTEAAAATSKSSEADKVAYLLKNMAKTVEVGSEWYIVSMAWITKW